MDLETILLSVRVSACALIFVLLFTYRDPHARWKMGVSLLASTLCGASLAANLYTIMFWQDELDASYLPWLTLVSVLLAMRVLWARGNMSKVLKLKRYDA